MFYKQALIN